MLDSLQGCGKVLTGAGEETYTTSSYNTKEVIHLSSKAWIEVTELTPWTCGGRKHSSGYPWICKQCAVANGLIW